MNFGKYLGASMINMQNKYEQNIQDKNSDQLVVRSESISTYWQVLQLYVCHVLPLTLILELWNLLTLKKINISGSGCKQ